MFALAIPPPVYVWTFSGITKNSGAVRNFFTCPKSGGFLVSPLRKLAIVDVQKLDTTDHPPFFEQPGAWVFNPPELRVKICDDLECLFYKEVSPSKSLVPIVFA